MPVKSEGTGATVAAVSPDRIRRWSVHLPTGHDGRFDLPPPGTLVGAWAACLIDEPDRQLLHADGGWTTRGEFLERTSTVAGRLFSAGLVAGDRVLISGPSSVDLAVAHVACLRLGLIVVPVNGAYTGAELAHIVADCRPSVALVDHDGWSELLLDFDPGIIVTGTAVDLPDGPVPPLDLVASGDPAIIGYTSGTTGAPKGAVLTQENLLAGAHAVCLAWRWTDADRVLLCLPLFHMHGLGVGLHGTLLAGGSAVLQQGFGADRVFDGIAEHECTMFFGVPTMYHRLADHDRVAELGRLRLCVAGSAPLSAALHTRFADFGVAVLERYGMTETVMLVSNPFDGERRAGSVGFPLPGVDLRLDPATAEILVRGPNVFDGYWDRPDATVVAFVADDDDGPSWFRTGDLGSIDGDGYVTIIGRAKELIISGGFNVFPAEVDEALAAHPAIAEVAVAGAPSEEWGEEVVAFVVAAEGQAMPTIDDLREFARGHLASHKLPRRMVIIDALPRNALGKVLRHELREAAPHA
ncbi:MAG: AMP-binding protein [Actinobacteria bacterium]|nr:AMP-binding protein [Actinomycetota bacterium]